ncbi:Uncharacterised protein [Vibrio cholerae]|nr:Uncharacterised protein [Vibrio cholerae]
MHGKRFTVKRVAITTKQNFRLNLTKAFNHTFHAKIR